jgi:hypothetical protein
VGSLAYDPRELLEVQILDAICPTEELRPSTISLAKSLAAQPGFATVKRQIRGGFAERVAASAATGQDVFLDEFG